MALTLRSWPLLAADGTPGGYAITAEHPGEHPFVLTGETFRQASLSMSVHDTRQRYLRVNDTALRRMGLTERELIGQPLPEVMAGVDAGGPDFRRHLRQVTDTGRPVRYETFSPASSVLGEQAWIIEMWPVRDPYGEVPPSPSPAWSSTSPHLRRAHAYDEGGRGLLLVAQLTQRWGSRQTGTGKTIWAEQPLPPC
ncbi:hypothetical protein SFUMM280S_00286 [Streptomyces fumanus]